MILFLERAVTSLHCWLPLCPVGCHCATVGGHCASFIMSFPCLGLVAFFVMANGAE